MFYLECGYVYVLHERLRAILQTRHVPRQKGPSKPIVITGWDTVEFWLVVSMSAVLCLAYWLAKRSAAACIHSVHSTGCCVLLQPGCMMLRAAATEGFLASVFFGLLVNKRASSGLSRQDVKASFLLRKSLLGLADGRGW